MTAGLEHKAVHATRRAHSDLGEFAAIAATYDLERVKERIGFGAFEQTIAAWQASGMRVPLHWEHRGETRNVIGRPSRRACARSQASVCSRGQVDLDHSELAREAWRSMKDKRVGLSFGN
jgi:Caudovirus prohead serine protease